MLPARPLMLFLQGQQSSQDLRLIKTYHAIFSDFRNQLEKYQKPEAVIAVKALDDGCWRLKSKCYLIGIFV